MIRFSYIKEKNDETFNFNYAYYCVFRVGCGMFREPNYLGARAELESKANAGDREAIKEVVRQEWATSGESESWIFTKIERESGFQPWARNASGASGLFQMMLPMHNKLFVEAGCDPSRWAEARCNARAAFILYQKAGRSPWVSSD